MATEKNEILRRELQRYELHEQDSKQELEAKFMFAYFIRHYRDKAAFIVDDATQLKAFILKEVLSETVLSCIHQQAQELLADIGSNPASHHANRAEWSLRDALLVPLGRWFNDRFFDWFKAECANEECGARGQMKDKDMMPHHQMRSAYGRHVSRVHMFQCSECAERAYFERFYVCDALIRDRRYRRGWCGEHCDAFAAIAHALDYRWRFALDDTDHIWLEIYSAERGAWCCFEPSPESDVTRYDYNKFADRKSRYIHAIDAAHRFVDVTDCYQSDKAVRDERRKAHCVSEQWETSDAN